MTNSAPVVVPRVGSSLGWLTWRALAVITRTGAFWAAAAAYVVLLSLFLLVWGDGVPAMDGSVLDQFAAVQMVALALVLPWVAFRTAMSSRSELALVAMLAKCSPAQVIAGNYLALSLGLVALTLCALPMMLIAAQVSAVEAVGLSTFVPALVALSAAAAACVAAATTTGVNRTAGWAASTMLLLIVTALAGSGVMMAVLAIALTVPVAAGAAVNAGRTIERIV